MKRIILPLLLAITTALQSQVLKKSEVSFSLGYLFEGEMYVWQTNKYASVGEALLFKGEYNYYFSDHFGIGGYVHYGSPYYGSYETISLGELGVVLKTRFSLSEKMLVKPGAYIGYRTYGSGAGTGLGINGSVTLQYVGEKIRPFIDVGIVSQPAGGNKATDITFGPVFQASLGVSF